ncbi:MAG: cysteine methyltransferase, partial [Hydrogenophilales bacterium 12-64-13]
MCRLGALFNGDTVTRLDFLPLDTPVSKRLDARAEPLACELAAYWSDPAHRFEL